MAISRQPNLPDTPQITLRQLLEMAGSFIKDAFPDNFWVVAEISELKIGGAGYCWMTLIEKSGENVVAKCPAVLWRSKTVLDRFKTSTGRPLASGMNALIQVKITLHPLYGFQLNVQDIDPNYTLGDLERQRREILERLTKEGLIERNKMLRFPLVPQRIAIISSRSAAGYEDFVHQLDRNPYGFAFTHELFHSAMQGQNAEPEILAALAAINKLRSRFDVVVLIRGGGASVDLSCFDSYAIGAAIASLPLPVITGIGHERNDTVADACGHTRVKTPTAAAERIIASVKEFSDRVESVSDRIKNISKIRIEGEKSHIDSIAQRLSDKAAAITKVYETRLDRAALSIKAASARILDSHLHKLSNIETSVRLLDPSNVLSRGYSITYHNGHALTNAKQLVAGDSITTRLFDGTIISAVTEIENADDAAG